MIHGAQTQTKQAMSDVEGGCSVSSTELFCSCFLLFLSVCCSSFCGEIRCITVTHRAVNEGNIFYLKGDYWLIDTLIAVMEVAREMKEEEKKIPTAVRPSPRLLVEPHFYSCPPTTPCLVHFCGFYVFSLPCCFEFHTRSYTCLLFVGHIFTPH